MTTRAALAQLADVVSHAQRSPNRWANAIRVLLAEARTPEDRLAALTALSLAVDELGDDCTADGIDDEVLGAALSPAGWDAVVQPDVTAPGGDA